MKIAIVTDSSCDLPEELLFQYNIRVVPFKVIIGSTIRYDHYLDFDRDVFYKEVLKGKQSFIIEEPSVEDFTQMYKKLAPSYDAVLSIHQSSRFSNAVKNARTAAFQGADLYRKIRAQKNITSTFQIRILDSKSISIGQGLLVLRAAELLYDEINFTKFANELESLADQIYFYLVPSDLSLLPNAKSIVKVSTIQAGLAGAFDQKVILINNKYETIKIEKVKGFETAVNEMIKMALERLHEKQSFEKVGIVFSGPLNELDLHPAINQLRMNLAGSGLGSLISKLCPAVGYYAGAGAIGIAIINGELSVSQLIGR